jgi:hypothetical protein
MPSSMALSIEDEVRELVQPNAASGIDEIGGNQDLAGRGHGLDP